MSACSYPENAQIRRLFTLSGLTLRELREATQLYDRRSSVRWITGGVKVPQEVFDYLQSTIEGYFEYCQEVCSSIENKELLDNSEDEVVELKCFRNQETYEASEEATQSGLSWGQYNARLNLLYAILLSRGHLVQWTFHE